MVITDGKLLLCHGISEVSVDKKISMREYNNRTVYDCFNNSFQDDCGISYCNLPPITIDNRTYPDKGSRYTPDIIPYTISVASEKSVSTLNTPSDSPQPSILTSNYPNHHHTMKKYKP